MVSVKEAMVYQPVGGTCALSCVLPPALQDSMVAVAAAPLALEPLGAPVGTLLVVLLVV